MRILIADDEPTLRFAVAHFFSQRGHSVTSAADAHEALRLAQQQKFDAALVDARMPGDGLALVEQLEAMPSLTGRTALMTGDIARVRLAQGVAGTRPCLTKPFDMNDALALVERLAEGKRG